MKENDFVQFNSPVAIEQAILMFVVRSKIKQVTRHISRQQQIRFEVLPQVLVLPDRWSM